MAGKTQETDLVPLDKWVGAKLYEFIDRAPNVIVAGEGDAETAMASIVNRLLDAETLQAANEVFEKGTLSSKELANTGQVFKLYAMEIRPGDRFDATTGERKWYALFRATDADDNDVIISSGSRAVWAMFIAADARGQTPAIGEFVLGAETDSGNNPVNLRWVV